MTKNYILHFHALTLLRIIISNAIKQMDLDVNQFPVSLLIKKNQNRKKTDD